MEKKYITSEEAASTLGINEAHFRKRIIPRMRKAGIKGIGRLGKHGTWRIPVGAIEEYLERSVDDGDNKNTVG